jgi:glycosyltransferase involved in cell wall biosynthesis
VKIAQIAPLFESVPPKCYGGTERVVSYLTEELVAQGHDVTLFASGDSVTRARLIALCKRATQLDADCRDPLVAHFCMLAQVADDAWQFDILHFHIDYLHFPMTQAQPWPHLTTMHGRLDLPELRPLHRQFAGHRSAGWKPEARRLASHRLHRAYKSHRSYTSYLSSETSESTSW